jgi:hypothetical protein
MQPTAFVNLAGVVIAFVFAFFAFRLIDVFVPPPTVAPIATPTYPPVSPVVVVVREPAIQTQTAVLAGLATTVASDDLRSWANARQTQEAHP